jgi:hypothetical protein
VYLIILIDDFSPFILKIQDAIGALHGIDEQQKEKVWELIQRFLSRKPEAESVTPVS